MGKFKWINTEKRCADQYRSTTTDPFFAMVASAMYNVPSDKKIVVQIKCKQTDKFCGYRNREKDCPYNPSNR
jgi:hypothetical protein